MSTSPHHNELSKSEERNTFQRDAYITRCRKEGKDLNDPDVIKVIEMYNKFNTEVEELEHDPEWKENNLEYDLRTTQWILDKVRGDSIYAQHVYAALCNVTWQKMEVWLLLKNDTWSCSWRHAGGIVADMRGEGDYIDWYCSGSGMAVGFDLAKYGDGWLDHATEEQIESYKQQEASVGEGHITDEIRADFLKLGWQPLEEPVEAI
jgi:hypothetical protein